MKEDEHFIIEGEDERLPEEDQPSLTNRFPVRRQLLLIGVFMFLLFAGFTIPKTLTLLQQGTPDTSVVATTNLSSNNEDLTPKKITEVNIYADAAFVWDVVGQRALYQKNADEALPLASITKLMTALVAYELVTDDTPVTISKTAAAQQSGGSLTEGEVFEVKDLADFALISSYNSAAYTLATAVGELLGEGDAVTQFVAAMNIRADELNLPTLEYANPTGLDVSATEASAVRAIRPF
jgi:D-alanyl-D-alanine carboxypeptidase